MNRTIS